MIKMSTQAEGNLTARLLAKTISARGRVAVELPLPSWKAELVRDHLVKAGCEAGISIERPTEYYTGVRVGSCRWLWAIVPNADGSVPTVRRA